MEERIHQRQELQDPTAGVVAAAGASLSSGDETDDGESEFEFPFVSRGSPALADELFADGLIKPLVYPVFGRRGGGGTGTDGPVTAAPATAAPRKTRGQLGRLFLEETRERNSSSEGSTASSSSTWTSSSAATDDDDGHVLEGAPPDSYCVWVPGRSGSSSQLPPRKSGSTGSMARWRRISDLVVGRSHSDGKEKFLFLPATPPPLNREDDKPKPRPKPNPASGGKKSPAAEANTVAAAHRIAYGAKARAGGGATPRRTFLPYREELVGFFANVNGVSRSHRHAY